MVLQITPEERAVLQLLADGNATTDIAARLGLSERALEGRLAMLLMRMGVANPVEAVADALRRGLLEIASPQDVGPATAAG
jgi:DNA-binding NarL/FixJ family response regulator